MNNFYSKYINIWLLSLATIILIMIAVGGLTRLTESGLSMVDWDPIMGIIPPLSQTDWNFLFTQYQLFPEYQIKNLGMTLNEFKFIFGGNMDTEFLEDSLEFFSLFLLSIFS